MKIVYASGAWQLASTPRLTKAQKTALTPEDGMVVYQTDNTPGLRVYVSGSWQLVSTVPDP